MILKGKKSTHNFIFTYPCFLQKIPKHLTRIYWELLCVVLCVKHWGAGGNDDQESFGF